MATIRKTAEKQVNAMRRIETASAAIAKNLKIEITPLPNTKKFDAEFARGVRLEHWATVFEQIAEATGKTETAKPVKRGDK